MADRSGRPHPHGTDATATDATDTADVSDVTGAIDDRLRELARDAEPLVVLAGAAAARARGEWRRARQRTGAVCLVAALAVGIGCWQVLPRLGTEARGTLPAATATTTAAPADGLAGRLAGELLPISALPGYPKRQWVEMPDAERAKLSEEECAVPGPSGARAQAGRTYYEPVGGWVASYRLYVFAGANAAATQAVWLGGQLAQKCGLAFSVVDDTKSGTKLRTYRSVSGGGGSPSIWMNRQDAYLAVFLLSDTGNPAHAKGDSSYVEAGEGKWPEPCIVSSLARLASAVRGAAEKLAGAATPVVPTSPTAVTSATGGSGTGHSAVPPTAEKLLPTNSC